MDAKKNLLNIFQFHCYDNSYQTIPCGQLQDLELKLYYPAKRLLCGIFSRQFSRSPDGPLFFHVCRTRSTFLTGGQFRFRPSQNEAGKAALAVSEGPFVWIFGTHFRLWRPAEFWFTCLPSNARERKKIARGLSINGKGKTCFPAARLELGSLCARRVGER